MGKMLALCLMDRGFIPGTWIVDLLLAPMRASVGHLVESLKKTVLVPGYVLRVVTEPQG